MSERSAKATVPGSKRRREAAPPTPERGEESENREAPKISYASALQKAYSKRVDAVDKKLGLSMGLTKQPRLSTGLLCYDLLLGNGLVPGMTVQSGAEQSAKSTSAMTILRSSLTKPIPIRKYFDVEGAVDRRYTGNILGTDSFTDIFGDKNRSGRWIKEPQCLYHDENITETVFRDMHHTAKMLPKKLYREDAQEWFLVFERDTQSIALMKELIKSEAINSPDKSLFSSTGRYYCSVGDDDSPQAVFFVDSLPMLVPEKVDEDEKGQGLAVDSRVLGQYLKRVRGVLRPKGVILVCVNQLRAQPMPKPGQPDWYEPAGNAVKYASDARTNFTSRVPQDGFPKWKEHGGICAEESVEFEGGMDLYAFKGLNSIKNKYGTPFRKTFARVWYKDGEGEPRGFDPAYDVWKFLHTIGAIEGFQPTTITDKRKKFFVNLKPVMDVEWTWPMFKAQVIAQYDNNRRMMKVAQDLGAPIRFNLRDYCLKLLKSGRTEDMLASHNRKKEKESGGIDMEVESAEE